jgi:hypothetical protein
MPNQNSELLDEAITLLFKVKEELLGLQKWYWPNEIDKFFDKTKSRKIADKTKTKKRSHA